MIYHLFNFLKGSKVLTNSQLTLESSTMQILQDNFSADPNLWVSAME